MADFCNKCSEWMFGPNKVDIDLVDMYNKSLKNKPNYNPEKNIGFIIQGFICEGCGATAIAKINDKMHIYIPIDEELKEYEWKEYETLNPAQNFKTKFGRK